MGAKSIKIDRRYSLIESVHLAEARYWNHDIIEPTADPIELIADNTPRLVHSTGPAQCSAARDHVYGLAQLPQPSQKGAQQ